MNSSKNKNLNLEEKLINSEYIYKGKILNLRKDSILLPNGKTSTREIIEHNGAAAILAINNNNEVLLVKQYRCPFKEILTEIPAGKLEKGENPKLAALRELEEETGYKANSIKLLLECYPSPGAFCEKLYIYLATNLEQTEQHLDSDEFLNVFKVPLSMLKEQILKGEIKDAKTVISVLSFIEKEKEN